jgi:hypothetical protein
MCEASIRYLSEKLKLKVNQKKSVGRSRTNSFGKSSTQSERLLPFLSILALQLGSVFWCFTLIISYLRNIPTGFCGHRSKPKLLFLLF